MAIDASASTLLWRCVTFYWIVLLAANFMRMNRKGFFNYNGYRNRHTPVIHAYPIRYLIKIISDCYYIHVSNITLLPVKVLIWFLRYNDCKLVSYFVRNSCVTYVCLHFRKGVYMTMMGHIYDEHIIT